ncbi:MAG: DNA polymerase III subunit epsilon [Holosporaceae bacterium]|jgi:DNA polymerase-3 subunit epsilon|nr:DNA polymerase III subunit epsilon [Holosporaceae bacterium]
MTIPKNLREVVLDTETTGLSHANGDRIVDIACVELINHIPTGSTYQVYINPEREMQRDAVAISGITDEFLVGKPLFHEIVDDFLGFVQDSILVIHNAKFDIGFLNNELAHLDKPQFSMKNTVDTLEMARKKFPGSPASLDALCKRFEIDTSARTKHGALIDCFLLAEVYINLLGGRQSDLSFHNDNAAAGSTSGGLKRTKTTRARRYFALSENEKASHEEFLKTIHNPIWKQ